MKSGHEFDPARYAPVADRITSFYAAFPKGRILTELMGRANGEIVFRASVYRDPTDDGPAATGWAAEREGDGEVNEVACLENTETSAVGRALANLGFTASRLRPSAEEMAKAARARARLGRPVSAVRESAPVSSVQRSVYLADFLTLIAAAERAGLRHARAVRWHRRLADARCDDGQLEGLETRLRRWVARQPDRAARPLS